MMASDYRARVDATAALNHALSATEGTSAKLLYSESQGKQVPSLPQCWGRTLHTLTFQPGEEGFKLYDPAIAGVVKCENCTDTNLVQDHWVVQKVAGRLF